MFKLYELSEAMNQVAAMIEEGADGLEDTLEALDGSFQEKVESIVKLMRSKMSEYAAIKAESDRLSARAAKIARDRDCLENYIEQQMIKTDMQKVPSSLFSITLATNPPKVEVLDQTVIPAQYIRTSTLTTPDKVAIKAAIESGEEVPGVKIVQTQSLRVR